MPGVNCRTLSSSCISPSHSSYPSLAEAELIKTALNMSPRVSSQSNPIVHLERTLHGHASWHWNSSETIAGCNTVQYMPPSATPSHKSSVELRKEIVTLEAEIMRLERYLLSLYRTAFEEHRPTTLSSISKAQSKSETRSPPRRIENRVDIYQRTEPRPKRNGLLRHYQSSPAHGWVSSDSQSCASSFKTTSTRDLKNASSGHRSLADHLSPSCLESDLINPDRLSEDIVRCISSIYCKLANPISTQGGLSTSSPTSSLSSSSIFSSHNPRDSWSPCRNEDSSISREYGMREENGPYSNMVEVLKICLDDDTFKFAAAMLQKFRSLVRSLEKVDPTKMKREEKLAFWINIHNALVMHAYLAYGTGSRVKTNTILKAAYSIGGHCINAYVIQNSILGIRSHHSSPWLQTLFSPSRKSKTGSSGHIYALEYPEPLVHFALCSGAYSDPPVRVYTAKKIFLDLKLAKEDFVQANVYIHKETKIFLPRILYCFAKDMALPMPGLLETVNECLSEVQQKVIKAGMKGGRLEKYINWLPENSTFRYVFHGELARGSNSV